MMATIVSQTAETVPTRGQTHASLPAVITLEFGLTGVQWVIVVRVVAVMDSRLTLGAVIREMDTTVLTTALTTVTETMKNNAHATTNVVLIPDTGENGLHAETAVWTVELVPETTAETASWKRITMASSIALLTAVQTITSNAHATTYAVIMMKAFSPAGLHTTLAL